MSTITFDSAIEFVSRSVAPLADRLSTDSGIREYVAELGWDELPSIPNVLNELHDSAAALRVALGHLSTARLGTDDSAILTAVGEVSAAFLLVVGHLNDMESSLQSQLPAAYLTATGIAPKLGRRIADAALIDAVASTSYMSRAVLFALGFIEEGAQAADPAKHQPAFTLREFRLDRLRTFFQGPSALLEDVYGWGTPAINEERLYRAIDILSLGLLSPSELVFPSDNLIDSMFPGLPDSVRIPPIVNIPLGTNDSALFELATFPAPITDPSEAQGLAFRLLGSPEASIEFGIGLGLQLTLAIEAALDTGIGVLLRPDVAPQFLVGIEGAASNALLQGRVELRLNRCDTTLPVRVFSIGDRIALEVDDYYVYLALETPPPDVTVGTGLKGGKLLISLGGADGFIRTVIPNGELTVNFDLGIGWSKVRGLFITGSAGLETLLRLNLALGPLVLEAIRLALRVDAGGLRIDAGLHVRLEIGPVLATVQGIGASTGLAFRNGNAGPIDLHTEFLPPTGIGIRVDAGAVTGGGVLIFESPRYFGAIELSVFSVSVKAFGLIETELPDGSPGFSFVIVISAEFTPIQLGFGFTLIGVGGLVGINRTVDAEALGTAARTGSLAHLLFPRNVVQDAPAIIHDLATVFPAARGHYIFGPMAKLGWGTPTLIRASIGVLIELPGPRLGLIGVVSLLLPSPEAPVLALQMAIAGLLDFPAKRMSIDAGLFDSAIAGFSIRGDMAYRLGFGKNPNFLMSVGGFNPDFDAPPGVPDLRRVSVELGVNGNPSLTASGYFALTSNTAQIGARIDLKASGYGIRLNGWFGMDALFVFSPFSFKASFTAGMRVSFHGAGIGVSLRGTLSGPNPWAISGKVCVSVLFWDACLSVDHTFGKKQRTSLPEIDPWEGLDVASDPQRSVRGLRAAIQDPRSWEGSKPPAGFQVVSLAASSSDVAPLDPLGSASLRQRVVPLETPITKFGEYRPYNRDRFLVTAISINARALSDDEVRARRPVEDDFAPAHFFELSEAERLSSDSYVPMKAGFSIHPDRITVGSGGSAVLDYETDFINDEGEVVRDSTVYRLSQEMLIALLRRSAAANGGVRQAGSHKYTAPTKTKKVTFGPKRFIVIDGCSAEKNTTIVAGEVTQIEAFLALRQYEAAHPQEVGHYRVAPRFAAVG